MNKFYLGFFFFVQTGCVIAQNNTGFFGKVIESKTQNPLGFVVVSVQNTTLMQLTKTDGNFSFDTVPTGNILLLIHSQGFNDALYPIEITQGKMLDLGTITLEEDQSTEQQNSIITLIDSDFSDDNSSSESTSGLLQSSRDAFLQAAAFNWGQARFRVRGLDSEHSTMMINGVSMNKIYDGRPQWGEWGGLNDALRNQEFTLGTAPSDYTFGGILGTQEINTRASIYRPGSRISFSSTNTNYNWRTMATHASGMNSRGWAFVVSAGKRWAQEAYFEGTNYDANSFFISLEKKLSEKHSLNLTAMYTPNSRAKNSPNTAEVTQLKNVKYNSYWGYQDGEKRNAHIKTIEEPTIMLNHYFKINDKTNLNSSVTYQFGKIANSNIDYQNANSPDPTYYRKMPSYYSSIYAPDNGEFSGAFTPDYENAAKSKTEFLAHSQIDWTALYQANQNPVLDANGTITGYEPTKSKYVLYEDQVEDQMAVATTNLTAQLSENIFMNAGASFKKLKSHNSQKLLDLLGGSYFEDIDAFYSGNQSQSDLNHLNRQVVVGDTYGYNYNYFANTLEAFTQFKFTYNKVDFYLAQNFSSANYQREGLYKNGIYETNSFGKSEKVAFENFGFKAGFNLKISGKQLFTFNAAHLTKAPSLRNTFANSRLNNAIVDGLESENISSLDASYVYRSPKLKARLTAYYALIKNATQISFFYAEGIFDDGAGYLNTDAFVSQTLTQLNKKNMGAEFSLEYQLSQTFKTTFSAAFGEYTYDSNPHVTLTNDAVASLENTSPVFVFGTAALKNYKQAGMPQRAYSVGIEYRDPKYWWISANVNYLTNSYIDISPISRTEIFYKNPASGFNFPEATEERAAVLLKQEKFDPTMLLNLVGGKSWRIYGKNVGIFASINNVLDVTYKTGGYQQARNANFRQINQDVSSGTPSFGPKYFYGYGRTYFVNLYINL
ncbi:carboxypeptidase-like regulatory domain-containing protein [Flavobacterium yafengii]|uniref:Carboxypeptidase-like regulatory domain-containing protein n=1 Tax=Flavobacterium yafengii TaxID=3041253 RepID=A0AAW6TFZ0_9FLAO|nr:carboxypeptidase-like regulatory domain-containing protein [Flavobacterium yafengii]MDI5948536.1 carboxypeptidase-like regulatory domain-containing protein [Flavobacterium yafengii]